MANKELPNDVLEYFQEKHIDKLFESLFHDVLQQRPENPIDFLLSRVRKPRVPHIIVCGYELSNSYFYASRIAQHYNVEFISRESIIKNTSKFKPNSSDDHVSVDSLMNPDVISYVISKLKSIEAENKGWVLEGFPCTRSQVLSLQSHEFNPDLVFFIHLSVNDFILLANTRYQTSKQNDATLENTKLELGNDQDEGDIIEKFHQDYKTFQRHFNEVHQCYSHVSIMLDSSTFSQKSILHEIMEQLDAQIKFF